MRAAATPSSDTRLASEHRAAACAGCDPDADRGRRLAGSRACGASRSRFTRFTRCLAADAGSARVSGACRVDASGCSCLGRARPVAAAGRRTARACAAAGDTASARTGTGRDAGRCIAGHDHGCDAAARRDIAGIGRRSTRRRADERPPSGAR